MKRGLARVLSRLERVLDRSVVGLRPVRRDPPVIEAYLGEEVD